MSITPWQFFIDFGVASLLLLIGLLVRAKIPFIQRLFLPACVIGGLLGLAFGPGGADILPLSSAFPSYPGILIALIFATLPFSSPKVEIGKISGGILEMWSYSSMTILLQWGLALVFALLVLRSLWPDLNPGFGAMLVSGFVGGHGTAAAIGAAFNQLGWDEATSLAMTSATVGILAAIVGGMIWIKWGAKRGHSGFIKDFDDLPADIRTGLVAEGKREALGEETVSGSTIDSLIFHFCLIGIATWGSYHLSNVLRGVLPQFPIPAFCLAYIAAHVLKAVFAPLGILKYVDRKTILHLGGGMTDLLVVFGIAAIQIAILVKYAVPLALLFCFGIALCWVLFLFLGRSCFTSNWFEKSVFTWGWVTGIVAMGIALLRIVDPKNKSQALNDYALAFLVIAPVEIGLVTFGPQIISSGHYWPLALITSVVGLLFAAFFFCRGERRTE
ncbi:sodium:glutamate symporter [bacterium]|nr:sodium:glutamate symporter [bacterium]